MTKSVSTKHLPNGGANGNGVQSYRPVFEAEKQTGKSVILKLMNPQQGNVYCPVYAENVKNPKTGNYDTVRLLKGVYTIWQSEQTTVTEQYAKRNRRSFVFHSFLDGNGNTQSSCTIFANDVTAIEAVKYLPANMDSEQPNRGSKFSFYEYNPTKQAEEQLSNQRLMVSAMQKAFTVDESQMRKHAWYLGVPLADEMGQTKGVDLLRQDYALKAQQQPKVFLDTLESPLVHVSFAVKKALSDGKIDLGRQVGTAHWSNGGFICKIPSNQKAADYLVELAMLPTEDGILFKDQLEKTL